MQRRDPDCSAGFNRFEASMAPPEVAPAPITVDLVDEHDGFREISISRITAFSRSSKSPR